MREAYIRYVTARLPLVPLSFFIGQGVLIQLDIIHIRRTSVDNQRLMKQIS